MADEQTRRLEDVIFDIKYGEPPPSTEAEEITVDTDSTGASEQEPTPQEQPSDESPEPKEEEPGTDGEPEPVAGESGEEGGESKDDEPETGGSDTITIDGETFTLEEVRAWRKEDHEGKLRLSDYTRKTQEVAAEREATEDRLKVMDEVLGDDIMGEMLKVHPEIMKTLVENPQATRELLGDASAVQKFWDQYELIADNPELAERFAVDPTAGADEAVAAAEVEQEARNILAIATHLDAGIDGLAAEFDGVDVETVKQKVLELARVPYGDDADPQAVKDGFARAFTLFFREEGDKVVLDDSLIRTQFRELQLTGQTLKSDADKAAAEHNAQVDQKLQDNDGPPASATSDGAVPEPEALVKPKDFGEALAALWE